MHRMHLFLCACALAHRASGDFAPSAALPPLLQFANGTSVHGAAGWAARRLELRSLLQEHILGTLPTGPPPKLASVTLLNKTAPIATACGCYVRLDFLCNSTSVVFDIQLAWPCAAAAEGAAAVPLFLTQWNHRMWGVRGVQRGYMMALYPGADPRDASGDFRAAYPAATFHKILARTFVASRVLDALLGPGLPQRLQGVALPRINAKRVCISGHSRNGKQSLIAAAFDERITAVVGSSPGSPIAAPVRFSSAEYDGEGVEFVQPTRDWWLPSLATYKGRENTLPADGHMVVALIAPRHALIATGMSDHEGDTTYASEMNIAASGPVYELLGAPNAARTRFRPGRHHGYIEADDYFDWFDYAGGVGSASLFPPTRVHAFNWSVWHSTYLRGAPPSPPPPPAASLAQRVEWLLGGEAALGLGLADGLAVGQAYCESGADGTNWEYVPSMMGRMNPQMTECKGAGCKYTVERTPLGFGGFVTANLYYPKDAPNGTALPVVIFLHGFAYHLGFSGAYNLYNSDEHGGLVEAMAARGVAVLVWDLPGFGMRQHSGGAHRFYGRTPHGESRLGAMVGEVHAALDFIHCATPDKSARPECTDGSSHTPPYGPLQIPALDDVRALRSLARHLQPRGGQP